MRGTLFFMLLAVLPLWGQQKEEAEVGELVRQLGDENWRVRKRAFRKLEILADKAVELLAKAAESDDLEVSVRARMLLRYLRVMTPQEASRLAELAKQFLEVPDPKRRAVVQKMRSIRGAAHWLIRRLTQKKGLDARKWAVMLHWFQFSQPFLWKERKYSVEELVLIKIVRDRFAYPATRYEALRALARFGSVKALVTVAHLAAGEVAFNNYKDADPHKFRRFAARSVREMLKRLKIPVEPPGENSDWTDFLDALTEASEEAKKELARLKGEQLRQQLGLRPLLGVYLAPGVDVNRDMGGAKIAGTKPGTGAHSAGLQPDDLITSIDGWTIRCWNDLVHAVRHCQPGDRVPVTILRRGKKLQLTVLITSDLENR